MTYANFETSLVTALQDSYEAGETGAIADWLLEDITGNNKQLRRQMANQELEPEILTKLRNAETQLMQHKPVQYVLGYSWFYGMKFLVNESVLIPRPETEELVEWVVNNYTNNKQPLLILDIGTGSGCIPVAIKKKLPLATVTSLDVSKEALQIAKTNAEINQAKIMFLQLDFLNENNWEQLLQYDVIISNPPYIPVQEKVKLDKNVIEWEPGLTLFVPDNDPLIFYRKIAAFGKTHLQKDGSIFMETHQDYASAVQQLFMQNEYAAKLKKDINGNERMVMAAKM